MLQLGFKDDIDPALSLKLISGSMLAFLNRHLPLTETQRRLFRRSHAEVSNTGRQATGAPTVLTTGPQDLPDASQQDRDNNVQKVELIQQQNGQLAGMQAGVVANGGLSSGLQTSQNLSGRTYESRVQASV